MDVIPIAIKINQTNPMDAGKAKGNNQTNASTNSFNQIFAMFHDLRQSQQPSEQKVTTSLKNLSDSINGDIDDSKNINSGDSENVSFLLASLAARIQQIQIPLEAGQDLSINDSVNGISQFQPNDGGSTSTLFNQLQQGTSDNTSVLTLLQQIALELNRANPMEATKLGQQLAKLIEKIQLQENQNSFGILNGFEDNFHGDDDKLILNSATVNNTLDYNVQLVTEEKQATKLEMSSKSSEDIQDMTDPEKANMLEPIQHTPVLSENLNHVNPTFAKEELETKLPHMNQELQQQDILVKQPDIFQKAPQGINIASDVTGNIGNQQLQLHKRNTTVKEYVPAPVVSVSQFGPIVSERIGSFLSTLPQQSGHTEAGFSLNLEHIGPVQIKITAENGRVTAQILTDTVFAKNALSGQIPNIRRDLQQQGILVQQLDLVQQPSLDIDLHKPNNAPQLKKLVTESSFITAGENKVETIPLRNNLEEPPISDPPGIIVNQQLQQSDKIAGAKEFVPLPIIPVSQFVSEVNKWIGSSIRTNPELSGGVEAKFLLSPENLGTVQIKIKDDNRKVTAQILTDTSLAKEALSVQLPNLRQTLQQHGILLQHMDMVQQLPLEMDLIQTNQTPLKKSLAETGFISEEEYNVGNFTLTKNPEEPLTFNSPGIMVNQQLQQVDNIKGYVIHPDVPVSKFVPEVNDWIGGFLRNLPNQSGSTVARFSLIPENLGSIQMNVTADKGKVTAKIVTDTYFGKETLLGKLPQLRQLMDQLGIQVQKLDIVQQPLFNRDLTKIYQPPKIVEETNIIPAQGNMKSQNSWSKTLKAPSVMASHENQVGQTLLSKPMKALISKLTSGNNMEKIPLTEHLEDKPIFDSHEDMVNQQLQQPEKMNLEKAFVQLPVVPVTQFVPEVRELIGGFLRTNHEKSGSTEARFSLNPEHLGPIRIKITTENGKVTAQIVTDTYSAKEALESQLPHLRQALQQHGIIVQKLEIVQQSPQYMDTTQTDQPFSQGGAGNFQEQRNHPSPQIGLKKLKESNQEEMEKELVIHTYGGAARIAESSIDFTA